MNLLNPGVSYLIISDPTNDQVVTISGNDISPSSSLEKEVLTRGMSSAGNGTQLNVKWNFNLEFADQSAFTTLSALPKTKTYRLTIVKLDGFVFWNEDEYVMIDDAVITDPESEDYPYALRMTHISKTPDINQKLNALAPFEDRDGDNLADGFTFSSTPTSQDFTNGIQEITTSDIIDVYKRIYLPAPGKTFKLSFTVNNAGTGRYISFLDEDLVEISTDNGVYGATGDIERDVTPPAGTYYIDIGARAGNGISEQTDAFSNLSFRPQSTDFANY